MKGENFLILHYILFCIENLFNIKFLSFLKKEFIFKQFRFLVLPDMSKMSKEVLTRRRADIFHRFNNGEEMDFNFMRFVDCMNKIRSNTPHFHQKTFSGNNPLCNSGSRPSTPLRHLINPMEDCLATNNNNGLHVSTSSMSTSALVSSSNSALSNVSSQTNIKLIFFF